MKTFSWFSTMEVLPLEFLIAASKFWVLTFTYRTKTLSFRTFCPIDEKWGHFSIHKPGRDNHLLFSHALINILLYYCTVVIVNLSVCIHFSFQFFFGLMPNRVFPFRCVLSSILHKMADYCLVPLEISLVSKWAFPFL